jgi:hypothetical protein
MMEHRVETKEFLGKNNPNWQGGLSFEPYPEEFNDHLKELIRERDGRVCQFCGDGESKRKMDVHHIDYDKSNCSPSNLISLCRVCNTRANYYAKGAWKMIYSAMVAEKFRLKCRLV